MQHLQQRFHDTGRSHKRNETGRRKKSTDSTPPYGRPQFIRRYQGANGPIGCIQHYVRRCSRRQFVLRCSCGAKGRVYFAECIPVCHHYTHGRKNSRTRKRRNCIACSSSGHNGHLFEHRYAGTIKPTSFGRRLSDRYPCGNCI